MNSRPNLTLLLFYPNLFINYLINYTIYMPPQYGPQVLRYVSLASRLSRPSCTVLDNPLWLQRMQGINDRLGYFDYPQGQG